jgi:hypothetical protein
MLKANLWSKSVPRVELDQRARDARLRLEQLERLLVPRAAAAASLLGWALCLFSSGRYRAGSQASRTTGPLSNRRPPGSPQIHENWIGVCGSCCG